MPSEHLPGYEICTTCHDKAFVYSAEVASTLPPGYHGENCAQCGLMACDVKKISGANDGRLKQAAAICWGCANMGRPTVTNGYWKHYDIHTAAHGVPCNAASVWGKPDELDDVEAVQ